MNFRCALGFHCWRSRFVGRIGDLDTRIGNVAVHLVGRDLWDNACQRKFVGLTIRLGMAEEPKDEIG